MYLITTRSFLIISELARTSCSGSKLFLCMQLVIYLCLTRLVPTAIVTLSVCICFHNNLLQWKIQCWWLTSILNTLLVKNPSVHIRENGQKSKVIIP